MKNTKNNTVLLSKFDELAKRLVFSRLKLLNIGKLIIHENDQKYLDRKKTKQEIYKKYGFNLIEVEDKDVQNLDDILPRLLLKYGVQAY